LPGDPSCVRTMVIVTERENFPVVKMIRMGSVSSGRSPVLMGCSQNDRSRECLVKGITTACAGILDFDQFMPLIEETLQNLPHESMMKEDNTL
jgi:hypothetical protein